MDVSDLLAWLKGSKYGIYCVAGFLAFWGTLIGSLYWLFRYIGTLTSLTTITTSSQIANAQVISPIDIAGVTATLGGLLLVGAFGRNQEGATPDEKETTNCLKRIGNLF